MQATQQRVLAGACAQSDARESRLPLRRILPLPCLPKDEVFCLPSHARQRCRAWGRARGEAPVRLQWAALCSRAVPAQAFSSSRPYAPVSPRRPGRAAYRQPGCRRHRAGGLGQSPPSHGVPMACPFEPSEESCARHTMCALQLTHCTRPPAHLRRCSGLAACSPPNRPARQHTSAGGEPRAAAGRSRPA